MIAAPLLVRSAVGVVAALFSLRFGAGIYFWRVTEALERPEYSVIAKLDNGVEIRQYEPYLIAETIIDGDGFRDPTGEGFRKCAGYIFGKNKKKGAQRGWFSSSSTSIASSDAVSAEDASEKMAMTAPVRFSGDAPLAVSGGSSDSGHSSTAKSNKLKVSFVIGKIYTLKTAPKPLDNKVKLRQVPAHTLAVKSFSGPPPNDKRVKAERETIERALAKDGRPVPGSRDETLVYGYHDPFITPKFLRRNEVALVLEGTV